MPLTAALPHLHTRRRGNKMSGRNKDSCPLLLTWKQFILVRYKIPSCSHNRDTFLDCSRFQLPFHLFLLRL